MTPVLRTVTLVAAFCGWMSPDALAQADGPAISGRVLAADADTPLRRARISIASGTWRSEVGLTDNEGRFHVAVSGAGSIPFTVTVSKGGFVTAAIKMERTEIQTPLIIRPLRGAAITGVVIDRSGAPAAGMAVTATRIGATDTGTPTQYSTTTDDLGEYRLAGLARGRYEIWAGTTRTIVVQPPVIKGSKVEPPITQQIGAGEKTSLTLETAGEIGGVQLVAPDERSVEAALQALRESGRVPPNSIVTMTGNAGATFINTPSTGPQAPEEGRAGALSGQLLSADRRPVPRAMVRVEGPFGSRDTVTDSAGAFAVRSLPPGQYVIRADVSEQMSWHFGQRAPGETGRPISLARGQVVQGIEIVLPPARAISGAIVDEHGEPVQGARIQAMQLRYTTGRTIAVPTGNPRVSDDRGRYRLWGLHPGSYLVSAFIDGFVAAGDRQSGYAKTYFPGTAMASAAVPIDLREDATANIAFTATGLPELRGVARDGDGFLVSGTARLVEPRRAGTVAEPRVVDLKMDGSFVFQHVPPGEYVLQVRGDGPGRTGLFGSQELLVGHEPVNVVIPTSYGASVEGRVVFDGQAEGVRVPVGIGTVALDDRARDPTTGVVTGSSEFFITNLFGHTALSLRTPSDEWFLKSWTIRGTDVVDTGYDFGTGPDTIDDSEIVLSRNGGVISGLASDGLKPADDYFVVVFPVSRDARWTGSRRVKLARSSVGGEFRVAALASGDYFVAAVSRILGTRDGGEWQNPDVLLQLEARAERITVSEGQTANVSLRVIDR
ncbi:MAG TPA: carboxypeptidase regulatory-like domain-containing protein [Vicinamibacterales bacterium]|nr:carboxypeptidase regulatory-like domain-containing protein [Vicinamibacterales bacterium]